MTNNRGFIRVALVSSLLPVLVIGCVAKRSPQSGRVTYDLIEEFQWTASEKDAGASFFQVRNNNELEIEPGQEVRFFLRLPERANTVFGSLFGSQGGPARVEPPTESAGAGGQ